MLFRKQVVVACVVFFTLSCGGMTSTDGGVDEPMDAGATVDAGRADAGVVDAGANDAGANDAGPSDAGTPDAGTPDAGEPDAGRPDAGLMDAGTVDAGAPDAGAMICTPNAMVTCYEGPAGTANVGACVSGLKTCAADGRSFGACMGQRVPTLENCATALDEDCDGQVNQPSAGCVCTVGSSRACYTGPAGTSGVGACQPGTESCNSAGTGYLACANQVLPSNDVCGNSLDDDCDGTTDDRCNATYTTDVKPIFQQKCAPCHTTGGSGGHNMATSYADTQLPSYHCTGLTKGGCSIVRINDGSMPAGAGCGNNPNGPGCLSATQKEIIQGWINSGQRP